MVLICISLMISKVEHLFMSLWLITILNRVVREGVMENVTLQQRFEKVRELTLPVSGGAASSDILGRKGA